MEKMSPDELKRRQEYLKEQREKLLKMKQQDREKQLTTALKSNPARPQSARAARAALANEGMLSKAISSIYSAAAAWNVLKLIGLAIKAKKRRGL